MTDKLRGKALALLARREHSRAQLARKLAPHAESEDELNSLLDDLVADGMVSDARYAGIRVASRGLRYGNARLAYDLGQDGVAAEEVAAALADVAHESGRCRLVWEKKFGTLPASLQERARQVRFLQSRGFSSASIRATLAGTELEDVS